MRGRPAHSYRLPKGVVTFSGEFEEVLAAQWRGISDSTWRRMAGSAKSRVIAQFRTYNLMQAIQADIAAEESKTR